MKFSLALIITATSILVSIGGCASQEAPLTSATVLFDNPEQTTFTVYIADSVSEQTLGLGDIATLPKDHGMLFIYSETDEYTFWMRNVEYPIDIIWLRDGTVVDITANIPPEQATTALTDYQQYSPNQPVNMVLEVGAGVTEAAGISIGQHLTIDP